MWGIPWLFKPELLGCLKDFELEVKFKTDAKTVFCKASNGSRIFQFLQVATRPRAKKKKKSTT